MITTRHPMAHSEILSVAHTRARLRAAGCSGQPRRRRTAQDCPAQAVPSDFLMTSFTFLMAACMRPDVRSTLSSSSLMSLAASATAKMHRAAGQRYSTARLHAGGPASVLLLGLELVVDLVGVLFQAAHGMPDFVYQLVLPVDHLGGRPSPHRTPRRRQPRPRPFPRPPAGRMRTSCTLCSSMKRWLSLIAFLRATSAEVSTIGRAGRISACQRTKCGASRRRR